ncbi:Putative DNA protecting protein DprA (modular protein) [Rhodospirillaceae bacterium LM-1]|nr:Putative DNA protecting protein DprA (modular protein) [Rhodospirillaceae bacterium LM-1]
MDKPAVFELSPGLARYPESVLAMLGRKAPLLYAQGNLDLLASQGIGFCGSRHASAKGLETAADCAEQAAKDGYVVISGNAAGIDFTAHYSALKAGGTTILVLPEGIDHFRIKKDLQSVWDWKRTLVVSQFEPAAVWKSYRAMERNDMIIALSRAMIVIEAGATGGTLHAGMRTLAVGKPLFVAEYQNIEEIAPGNKMLLEKGGLRLARSRTTGRAYMERVRNAAEHVPVAHPPLKRAVGQASLF